MSGTQKHQIESLVDSLLACPFEQLPRWAEDHRMQLDLDLIKALKQRSNADYVLSNPQDSERATRYAIEVASLMPEEQLALPLARWARGNWAMFHAPHEAVTLYQQAYSGYRAAENTLGAARIQGNLVGVLTDCGRFTEAENAYRDAHREFLTVADSEPLFLLRLEQNYGWLLHSQGKYNEALETHRRALTSRADQ